MLRRVSSLALRLGLICAAVVALAPARARAQAASLDVIKSVSDLDGGAPTRPGDRLRYTITVASTGQAVARGVVLSDTLPVGVLLVDAPGAMVAGATLRWDLGDLAPNRRVQRTFTVRLRAPLPDGTVVSNQAFASAAGGLLVASDDPATAAAGDPTAVVVRSAADFRTRSSRSSRSMCRRSRRAGGCSTGSRSPTAAPPTRRTWS